MRAEAKSLRFLGEQPQLLKVPFFQRSYVWKNGNWEEMLESIKNANKQTFLGSIILKTCSTENPTSADIIDGQQRLTTIMLLAKSVYDVLKSGQKVVNDETLDEIKANIKNFLFYKINAADEFSKAKVKIQHSRLDADDFQAVISGGLTAPENDITVIGERSSKVLQCYKFFYEQLLEMPVETILAIFNNLFKDSNKMIVLISLEKEESNEQLIFDTINRAGVRLSAADIVKNAIFEKALSIAGRDEQKRSDVIELYQIKWENIFLTPENVEKWDEQREFGNVKRTNLEFLLYCVAFIRCGKTDEIFFNLPNVYKSLIANANMDDIAGLAADIAEYAKIFKTEVLDLQDKLNDDEEPLQLDFKRQIRKILFILEKFGVQMFYPYILKRLKETPDRSNADLLSDFAILESFIVRRRLARDRGVSDYAIKCDEIIKNGITKIKDEFKEDATSGILDSDIFHRLYDVKDDTARLVLFIIELYRRNTGRHDEEQLQYRYTLEHIMPKKWQTNWNAVVVKNDRDEELLEVEAELERKRCIGAIGNMTLLTQKLNSSLSNSSFADKMINDSGYKNSTSLRITAEIVNTYADGNVVWNEASIRARTQKLFDEIKTIWKNPLV